MSKILVIDDSAAILAMVGGMLTPAGHEVFSAATGKEALAMLGRTSVDLVITDMYMPEMDGMEVMFQVRKSHPQLPLIAMSSKSGPFNMFSVARVLGAVSTLQKPFNEQQLQCAVNEALGLRKTAP